MCISVVYQRGWGVFQASVITHTHGRYSEDPTGSERSEPEKIFAITVRKRPKIDSKCAKVGWSGELKCAKVAALVSVRKSSPPPETLLPPQVC